jgi:hypothetical protein
MVSCVGDRIDCKYGCTIVNGDPTWTLGGKAVALHGVSKTTRNCTCLSNNNDLHGRGQSQAEQAANVRGQEVRSAVLVLLTAAATATTTLLFHRTDMDKSKPYKLSEPMLISTAENKTYYMVPPGTVLFHQRGFAEGHQLYTMEVLFKGDLAAEPVPKGNEGEATWLWQIDRRDVSELMKGYPLAKDDLVRILKARKMTREDLAQIVREWKDE